MKALLIFALILTGCASQKIVAKAEWKAYKPVTRQLKSSLEECRRGAVAFADDPYYLQKCMYREGFSWQATEMRDESFLESIGFHPAE